MFAIRRDQGGSERTSRSECRQDVPEEVLVRVRSHHGTEVFAVLLPNQVLAMRSASASSVHCRKI